MEQVKQFKYLGAIKRKFRNRNQRANTRGHKFILYNKQSYTEQEKQLAMQVKKIWETNITGKKRKEKPKSKWTMRIKKIIGE